MKPTRAVLVALVLVVGLASPSFAQTAAPAADVLMVIAELRAEIARLHAAGCQPAPAAVSSFGAVPSRPPTLGEASEAAKGIEHAWPLSTGTVSAPAATSPAVVVGTPAAPPPGRSEATHDEPYWRARTAPLHQRIAAALTRAVPLNARIAYLTEDLNGIGPLNARRGGVETERQRLITEALTLDEGLATDRRALADIEEEGRRVGALPGWFR